MRFSFHTFTLCVAVVAGASHYCPAQEMQIFVDREFQESKSFSDTLQTANYVQNSLMEMIFQGYPFCGIDSISQGVVYIHRGTRTEIRPDSVVGSFGTEYPKIRNLNKWIQERIQHLGQSGYPFASISIHPTSINSGFLKSYIQVNSGPYISWDSIHFVNVGSVDPGFLQRLLDIRQGAEFSEKTFRDISKRINRASYLKLEGEPDISFASGKATPYLNLSEVQVSSFEGIIGILSNEASAEKAILTGFFNLHLDNLFSSGKTFDLKWNRFGTQSQSLEVRAGYPYPIGSNFIVDFEFGLLKQDTSFLNQNFRTILSTYIGPATRFLAGYQRMNGSLITVDLTNLGRNLADFSNDRYEIGFDHNAYTAPFSFGNSIKATGNLKAGTKQIRRNPALPESFYDTLIRKTTSYQLQFGVRGQKTIARRSALYMSASGGGIWNKNLFESELYRLGGLATLRGFNENVFFARQYGINQLEWRQYFETSSYFFLFYDQAWFRMIQGTQHPYGVGAGFSLDTSSGLLNFVMAVGGSSSTNLDFANTKVHIGYQATF